jgi:hypothetical protein
MVVSVVQATEAAVQIVKPAINVTVATHVPVVRPSLQTRSPIAVAADIHRAIHPHATAEKPPFVPPVATNASVAAVPTAVLELSRCTEVSYGSAEADAVVTWTGVRGETSRFVARSPNTDLGVYASG